jgi:hypothetical protein
MDAPRDAGHAAKTVQSQSVEQRSKMAGEIARRANLTNVRLKRER